MFNPFKKPSQKRNADGTFTGPGADSAAAGSIARGTRDIEAVAKASEAMAKMRTAQAEANRAEQDSNFQRFRDMMEAAMPEGEGEGGDMGVLADVMKTVQPFMPQIIAKFTNQPIPAMQTQSVPGAAQSPAPASVDPSKEFDNLLSQIAAVPDKMFNKKTISAICKAKNLNENNLKKVVKKLHKVM